MHDSKLTKDQGVNVYLIEIPHNVCQEEEKFDLLFRDIIHAVRTHFGSPVSPQIVVRQDYFCEGGQFAGSIQWLDTEESKEEEVAPGLPGGS